MREDLPGEPLGLRVPVTVPAALALGCGSALSAPWPMPVAALVAAARGGDLPGPVARPVLQAVGAGVVLGTLIEPVTRRPATWSRGTAAAIALNLLGALALIRAGRRPAPGGIAGMSHV